ncbi:hypothetical protein B4168_2310 [Anoxybacillus flavithermus]|nr:hypothetical protein B4168_2310 [Anoxybacillus flavithermus]OAO85962.1 hypothetical protein GT23_2865 [Parageobacillus thermoglucosidasius]
METVTTTLVWKSFHSLIQKRVHLSESIPYMKRSKTGHF